MANIRSLSALEMTLPVEWAAREGWNPGLDDVPAFLADDPGAFLVLEEAGVARSCISAVRYGSGMGFIGFYIADPAIRGRGLGFALWQAAMARLEGRVIGLDGVVAQQENYRKSGFALAWNNARYTVAKAPGGPLPQGVLPAADVDFGALVALDAACFGTPRPAFLRAWIDTPGHVAVALPGGTGLAVLRPCREGHKVGPLLAPDAAGARLLFQALAARAPGPLTLDVPEDHAPAVALAREAGMEKVFETARMYAGPAPAIDRARLFGVASFELG